MRILYTDLYMGRRYVRLNDGSAFEAYLVDEDRHTYTFRKVLESPEEFIVRRDNVLFISRSNQTDLRGEVQPDRVRLEWFPPYRKPDRYVIYMKKHAAGETYRKIAATIRPRHTVGGLVPKTIYSFKVTAIDAEGTESAASNEITVKTTSPPYGAVQGDLFDCY